MKRQRQEEGGKRQRFQMMAKRVMFLVCLLKVDTFEEEISVFETVEEYHIDIWTSKNRIDSSMLD